MMTDTKSQPNPLFLRDDELRQGIEMLFFGSGMPMLAISPMPVWPIVM